MPEPRHNIGVESPGFSAAMIREDDDGWKFLLLQRAGTETYGGTWGFVTGSKKDGETMAQAVAREVTDETGLTEMRLFATEYIIQFYEPANDRIWMLPLMVVVVPQESEVKLSAENQDHTWLLPHRAKHRVTWKKVERAIGDIEDELELFPARNWVEVFPD